jgi:hypothetical protein
MNPMVKRRKKMIEIIEKRLTTLKNTYRRLIVQMGRFNFPNGLICKRKFGTMEGRIDVMQQEGEFLQKLKIECGDEENATQKIKELKSFLIKMNNEIVFEIKSFPASEDVNEHRLYGNLEGQSYQIENQIKFLSKLEKGFH